MNDYLCVIFVGSGFNQGINQTLNAGNSGNTTPAAGQPSTQQLRMLVQQIQMAVGAGYLNHQILNQPLAPTTLVLLNQLLAHIKVSVSYTGVVLLFSRAIISHSFKFIDQLWLFM